MNNSYFYLSKFLAPLLNPTNFIIIGILILFLIYLNSKNKIIYKILCINIILFIFVAFFPLGKLGLKYLENDFIKQKPIKDVVNIFVLAGSEDIDSTTTTKKLNLNSSSERLIASVKLANNFDDSKIYYIGGSGFIVKKELNENSVAKKFYQDIDFDLNKIIFVGNTRNTIENLKEIKNLNLNQSYSIIITSAFHMKRVMMISEKFELNLIPYSVDFRSISHNSTLNSFQKYSISSNLGNFDLFIREIIGIIAFKVLI